MREVTDRREEYYERAAAGIAADPLAFYSRAERGRKVQAGFCWNRAEPVAAPPVVETRVTVVPFARKSAAR